MGGDGKQEREARQRWLIRVTALLSLMVFLLIALLMIGIPYLNANLIQSTGVATEQLASSQMTSLVALVGTLITAVFVITAFRTDATAKNVASNAAKEVVDQEVEKELTKAKANLQGLSDSFKSKICIAESKVAQVADKGREDIAEVVRDAKADAAAAVKNAKADFKQAIQDSETHGTEARNRESRQFRRATDAALAEFEQEVKDNRAVGQAVREFLDERAPGMVRESFTPQQMEAIQQRVAAQLTQEYLVTRIGEALRAIISNQPQLVVDPVAERVAKMAHWRWLFRGKGGPTN